MGMLVVSRRRDESIYFTIPPSDKKQVVKVTAIELRGDKARIGIAASGERDEIQINRAEILQPQTITEYENLIR